MKQFEKCSILKEKNSHYSNSSNKLRDIFSFGEMNRTDGKYAHGEIMPMTEEDKARDREEIRAYMSNENYKEVIFKLNELIRHLLIDSGDVKGENLKYWIDYWDRIESENQDIIDEIYNV